MVTGEVEVLLVVDEFDMDKDAETELVKMYINITEDNMEREDDPGKFNKIVTVETFKEKEKGIMVMGP